MHKVLLENIRFHAKHGVFEEEALLGGIFELNLEIHTDFTEAMNHDTIKGTIDYSKVYDVVELEMKKRSQLIEHVGKRIINRIYSEFDKIQFIRLKISKLNPPIAGQIERVSIVIEE